MIPLESIRIDGGTQIRLEIRTDVVQEYAELIAKLPPITVFFDGSTYWLADGFHRYHAARMAVLPFDDQAAAMYGPMRADLERAGQRIGPLDMLIAAHALALGVTLVTNNEREFCRVPGLLVENWLVAE
jgi:predicted nucleic acid-binding protein